MEKEVSHFKIITHEEFLADLRDFIRIQILRKADRTLQKNKIKKKGKLALLNVSFERPLENIYML